MSDSVALVAIERVMLSVRNNIRIDENKVGRLARRKNRHIYPNDR